MGSAAGKGIENPTAVVVGAGYAGVAVSKALSKHCNVVLLDKKNYFQHKIGLLRGVTEESWAYRCAIPLDKLLPEGCGTVVQAEVASISPQLVTGVDGKSVGFDYLCIATGSSARYPGHANIDDAVTLCDALEATRQKVAAASSVIIVGGGAVGVELCGEIKDAFPECEVTLVHSSEKFVHPALLPGFHKRVHDKLRKMGVTLKLGDRAVVPEGAKDLMWYGENATLLLESGEELCADLIFLALGLRHSGGINCRPFEEHFAGALDKDSGRLNVLPTQQVVGHEHVFALGDCCRTPNDDIAQAFHAEEQAKIVVTNIAKLIEAKVSGVEPKLKQGYPLSGKTAFVLPLGKKDGVGVLPLGKNGRLAPRLLVTNLKSKNLFTNPTWKKLGYTAPKSSLDAPTSPTKRRSSASSFQLEELGGLKLERRLSTLGKLTDNDVDQVDPASSLT